MFNYHFTNQKNWLSVLERSHPQASNVKITYSKSKWLNIQLQPQCKVLKRLSVLRKPLALNKWKRNISKFCFYFCLQYALIITFLWFSPYFPKNSTKKYSLWAFTRQVVPVTFYNFKKLITHSPFLDNACTLHFRSSFCLSILYNKHYQCLS